MHSLDETRTRRRARNLAALLELGFVAEAEPATTESLPVGSGKWRSTRAVPAMGTEVTVSAVGPGEDATAAAIETAFATMWRSIDLLNRFDSASALGLLNRDGHLDDAPDELLAVLEQARTIQALSQGAFDISVAPVIDVFREHRELGLPGLPDEGTLVAAQSRLHPDSVTINGRSVRLAEGATLTLDGIAKGYVVDRMALTLGGHGLSGFLINAGGDIRTAGHRNGTDPWRVGVQDPERPRRELHVLQLRDAAIATSGSYEIYFDQERTRHHIVSPQGESPGECLAVTVRAPSAMQADALATAAFVAGPADGLALVQSLPGCSGLVVTADGQQRSSSSWLRSSPGAP